MSSPPSWNRRVCSPVRKWSCVRRPYLPNPAFTGGGSGACHLSWHPVDVRQHQGLKSCTQESAKIGRHERADRRARSALSARGSGTATRATRKARHCARRGLPVGHGTGHNQRPHRSLPQQATPATAYGARPKPSPVDRSADAHDRVRRDKISKTGNVSLRTGGRLHHIGIGRTYAGTHVLLLVQDLDIRVLNAATGELLRELTLDPTRDYQPTGRPPGPQRNNPGPNEGSGCPRSLERSHCFKALSHPVGGHPPGGNSHSRSCHLPANRRAY